VVLSDIVGYPGLESVLPLLNKMGTVKVGESGIVDCGNYYFKLDAEWVVLIVEEYEAIKLIAPESVIERILQELGIDITTSR